MSSPSNKLRASTYMSPNLADPSDVLSDHDKKMMLKLGLNPSKDGAAWLNAKADVIAERNLGVEPEPLLDEFYDVAKTCARMSAYIIEQLDQINRHRGAFTLRVVEGAGGHSESDSRGFRGFRVAARGTALEPPPAPASTAPRQKKARARKKAVRKKARHRR